MTRARALHARIAGGFTLIEVLIGVLVLAIGLLGLGGLISVVVRQQTLAVEVRQAQSARQTVELFFNPDSALIDWDHLRRDFYMSATRSFPAPCPPTQTLPVAVAIPQPENYGKWEVGWDWNQRETQFVTEFNQFATVHVGGGQTVSCVCPAGGLTPQNPNVCTGVQEVVEPVRASLLVRTPPAGPPAVLPVGTRLVPQAYSGPGVRPSLVWDFYPRRLPVAPGQNYTKAPLQVAVFIRGVDAGIQIPQGRSLSDVLTGTGTTRRFPVGVDPATGLPTRDGTGRYAQALSMQIDVPSTTDERVTRLTMRGDATLRRLASQPGQRLVDSLGLVQTVVEVDPANASLVVVEPGYSAEEAQRLGSLGYREVIFTPQVPVDVFVKTIR